MISSKKIKKGQIEDFISDATQTALDLKLSNNPTDYTDATTPLAGTEIALVEQGGTFKKVAVSELGGEKEIQCFWNSFTFSALNTWRTFGRNTSNIYFGTPNQSLGTGTEPTKVGTWFGDSNLIKINGGKQIKKFILSVRQQGNNLNYETFFVVADYTNNRGSELNGQILSNETFLLAGGGSTYVELTPNIHSDINDNSVLYIIIRQVTGASAMIWQGVDFKIIYE